MSSAKSQIAHRRGDASERKKANDNIAQISFLRSEYSTWKSKLQGYEEEHEHQKEKLQDINNVLLQARDDLSAVEEEIDSDPLPEGAQPKSRLQKRDSLRMVRFSSNLNLFLSHTNYT